MDIRKLQRAIVDGLEDVKAQDILVFNTEHLSPLFERVIIASGTSNRQAKALAASVRAAVRAEGFQVLRTEGQDNGEWIIVDCAAAVVHIMQPVIRQYYNLEDIWGDKPVAIKLKATKVGLVKASEDMDDEPPAKKAAKSAKGTAKPTAVKTAAKKVAAKKAPAKKAPAKKVAGKTVVAKKVVAKKVAAKKVATKQAPTHVTKIVVNAPKPALKGRNPAIKRVAAKKVATKRVAGKKVATKKAPARKPGRG
jgi:ribosome-associated protein